MKIKQLLLPVFALLAAAAQSQAALLLQNPGIGGESVYWEMFQGTAGVDPNRGLSSGNAAGTPAAGTGTIVPVSPGYRASVGYYSFMGGFGLTATTAAVAISDIQSVVFQRVSMANPDASLDLNLNWDGNATGVLGAAPAITLGGPWLSYYDASNNLLGKIQATYSAIIGGAPDMSLGAFSGDVYNFAYQWDLSGVAENVASVRIDAPIIVHSATVEARIDISGGFTQVIPEPGSTSLLGIGLAGLLIRRRR